MPAVTGRDGSRPRPRPEGALLVVGTPTTSANPRTAVDAGARLYRKRMRHCAGKGVGGTILSIQGIQVCVCESSELALHERAEPLVGFELGAPGAKPDRRVIGLLPAAMCMIKGQEVDGEIAAKLELDCDSVVDDNDPVGGEDVAAKLIISSGLEPEPDVPGAPSQEPDRERAHAKLSNDPGTSRDKLLDLLFDNHVQGAKKRVVWLPQFRQDDPLVQACLLCQSEGAMKISAANRSARLPRESSTGLVERRFSKAKAIADRLGVCPRTIFRWADDGKLARHKINARVVLFDEAEVLALLQAAKVSSS